MRHFWRIGILILWGFLRFEVHAADCFQAPDGLIGLWNAEFLAKDLAGHSNGVLNDGAVITEGKIGQGFSFNGSTARVSLGTPSALDLPAFTIHAWVRRSSLDTTSLSNPGAGIIFAGSEGGYGFGFTPDGTLSLGIIGIRSITGAFAVRDLAWHHVGVSKSGSVVRFYLDGVAGPEIQTDFAGKFQGPFSIGALGTPFNGQWFSLLGSLDEVAVYHRVLSPGEIQQVAKTGDKSLLADPSTLGEWATSCRSS